MSSKIDLEKFKRRAAAKRAAVKKNNTKTNSEPLRFKNLEEDV